MVEFEDERGLDADTGRVRPPHSQSAPPRADSFAALHSRCRYVTLRIVPLSDLPTTVRNMSHAASFDPTAVNDAAEALRTQVDLLLDRAADRLLNMPTAGTSAWHAAWQSRDSTVGLGRARTHRIARIAVASRAGFDVRDDVRAARAGGATTSDIDAALGSRRGARRSPSRDDQLALFGVV